MERSPSQSHSINTCPTTSLAHAKKPEQGLTHLAHGNSLQLLSRELLPTFPAQTQRHGQASELPFLTQRNARQAAAQGGSPDSTCHIGDLGFISTSQMQDGGGLGWKAGKALASESKVKRTHPLQALHSTLHSGKVSGFQRHRLENHSPEGEEASKDTCRMILLCILELWEKLTLAGPSHIVLLPSWKN